MTTLVTGHTGLVGSALLRQLSSDDVAVASSAQADLRDREQVWRLFRQVRPHTVYHAATRSGGILANTARPAELLSDNLRMQINLLDAAHEFGAERFCYIASSRVYPARTAQPMTEEQLLTGPLQPGLEPYAVGKLAGIMQVQALRRQFGRRYLSVIPCNLYGPDDHFDNPGAHVIPMLMHRLHLAKMSGDSEFTIYGTGRPRREFLHADDMAAACVRLMNYYDGDLPVNIGSGEEVTIDELTRMIAAVIGFQGSFTHDTSKPDGVEGQVLDSSRLRETGWSPKVSLAEGLASTYMAYLKRL